MYWQSSRRKFEPMSAPSRRQMRSTRSLPYHPTGTPGQRRHPVIATALRVEISALHHQLAVLQRPARGRPRLRPADRALWVWLCRMWSDWRRALVIVKPEPVFSVCEARGLPRATRLTFRQSCAS